MLKTMVGGHDFIIPRAFLPNIGILKAPAKIFFYKLHKYILGVIFFSTTYVSLLPTWIQFGDQIASFLIILNRIISSF